MHAEPFRKFLEMNIKLPHFPIVRPFDWGKLFATIFFAVTLGTITKLAWPTVKKIATNRNVWAVGCLVLPVKLEEADFQVTILMFTSGHMFNSIRHTPFLQANGRGGFNYIAGGFQSQLGIETQIVAALCN